MARIERNALNLPELIHHDSRCGEYGKQMLAGILRRGLGENRHSHDTFTQFRIGQSQIGSADHERQALHQHFGSDRIQPFSPTTDRVVDAPDNPVATVSILAAQVAAAMPERAVRLDDFRGAECSRIPVVLPTDMLATEHKLPHCSARHLPVLPAAAKTHRPPLNANQPGPQPLAQLPDTDPLRALFGGHLSSIEMSNGLNLGGTVENEQLRIRCHPAECGDIIAADWCSACGRTPKPGNRHARCGKAAQEPWR